MDRHVPEQAARRLDVIDRRRRRIVTDDVQRLDHAHLARSQARVEPAEVRIEAPVEAEKEAGSRRAKDVRGRPRFAQVEVNRLLAEDRLSGFDRADAEVEMRIGRARDDGALD